MADLAKTGGGGFEKSQSVWKRITVLRLYEALTGYSAETNPRPGGRFQVRCPDMDHQDQDPSCFLNTQTNTWKCFSCPKNDDRGDGDYSRVRTMIEMVIDNGKATNAAEAAEFAETIVGKDLSQRLKVQPVPISSGEFGQQLNDEYVKAEHYYQNAAGENVYVAKRIHGKNTKNEDDKRFEMWSPNKHGVWRKGLPKAAPRFPYNLPKVIAAAQAKRAIIVVEGELKADILNSMGFVATTHANGTRAEWLTSWSEYFTGCPCIYVLADSDTTGRRGAQRRADLLQLPDRQVVVVDLFPDRSDGSDIVDWMREQKFNKKADAAKEIKNILNAWRRVTKTA